jgi:enoyl-CoA hydratase/carnithine racemase
MSTAATASASSAARLEREFEMADEPKVMFERRGPVGHLVLNRPRKLNAIDTECVDLIEELVATIEADDQVRVVVVSGRGRAFSAGADLGEVEQAIAEDRFGAFLERWHRGFGVLERCSKPTIAAVHGFALAGGFELTQVCDLLVVGANATIGDQHANFGLFPGGGSTQRLPRMIGRRHAAWMLLSGEAIDAATALEIGLANLVAADEDVVKAAEGLATVLAQRSVSASAAIKDALHRGRGMELGDALDLERSIAVLHMRSADAATGLAAFRNRVKPDFGWSPEPA